MVTERTPPRLYVDGYDLAHRAYFGFPTRVRSRTGKDITLVFGFFALIRAAARRLESAAEVIVTFDGEHASEDRRALMPGYKPPILDGGFADLPIIYRALRLLGIACLEHDRAEGDDVIATLISSAPHRDHVILSTDKDFYQLLAHNVTILNTRRRAQKQWVDADYVRERYRAEPIQWCDFRALVGDPADAIPGVRGIGEVTAARLLAGGYHLEELPGSDRLAGRPAALLDNRWDDVFLWRRIIRSRTDVALPAIDNPPQPTRLPPAPEIVGELGLWK